MYGAETHNTYLVYRYRFGAQNDFVYIFLEFYFYKTFA
jgi:hypothetical protein